METHTGNEPCRLIRINVGLKRSFEVNNDRLMTLVWTVTSNREKKMDTLFTRHSCSAEALLGFENF